MRWLRLGPSSVILVPPSSCPGCGWGWPTTGLNRPVQGFMGCDCAGAARHGHTGWTCIICGCVTAEGCVDVSQWHGDHVPAGLPAEMRWGVPETE